MQNFSGSFTNGFGHGKRKVRRGPGRTTGYVAGEGDGRITVETFSGSVKIEAKD